MLPLSAEDASDAGQVPLHLQLARPESHLAGHDQHAVRDYHRGRDPHVAVETRVLQGHRRQVRRNTHAETKETSEHFVMEELYRAKTVAFLSECSFLFVSDAHFREPRVFNPRLSHFARTSFIHFSTATAIQMCHSGRHPVVEKDHASSRRGGIR